MELSQGEPLFSVDPSTEGFDLSAGANWIYPLNYQFREYQYRIVKNALFSNTLVCLPTGLGKTLIAAVVMFNFWRWYPRGKIVFLAPTKPLVAQQISACNRVMGIPTTDTIELTGSMNSKHRQVAWFTKRVIFATPQVFQNDLEKNIASAELIRCVVIDEAHKALGKHSYCESLRILRTQNAFFRVLALSATPGSRIEDVCQVMKNLLISNLELRDETSPDIVPYLNKKQMDIILVPLDAHLARFKEKYVSIMDRYVRLLVHYNVLKGDASTITKGRIFYVYKDFQSKTNRSGNHGQIMKTLSRCMSLYHAYELLIRHGLRAFTSFCQSHSSDIWITDEPALKHLIDEILSFLGPFPNMQPLPDGSVEEVPKDIVFGHTKFYKLKSLLVEHFEKFAAKNEDTRAIVFVEYRDSVNEVYVSLLQLRPTLRPKMFVGQAGQKRKQQIQAMEAFRNNEANVLISTSVGEEGLDVGEVDLIICFDISQSSPIRLVQRMGRTGRRRDGRIVMLVTDGKEHQALKSTIARKDSLNKMVLCSGNVVSAMYQENPRMVPPDFNPVCSKMHIVPQPKSPVRKGKRKRKEKDDPRKETKQKSKVAKSEIALPDEVDKIKPMQSSMLKFLIKPSTNKESNEVLTHVAQPSQASQPPSQVSQSHSLKLLTSDAAAVEFLTLCAIQASKLDDVRHDVDRIDETYLMISGHDDIDNFFEYPLPDFDILNSMVYLEEQTKCPSPEYNEDLEFDEIDTDVYVPQHNQLTSVAFRDNNNSPAVGKFDYEELFEDSCESDEMASLNNRPSTMLDKNLKALSENEKSCKLQCNEESNIVGERLPQNENNYHAALQKDDYFDVNKRQCEGENNLLKIGCFESILDQSSDSDIPSSQSELDSRRSTKTRGSSPASYIISEKQIGMKIKKSTSKPLMSSASDLVLGNQKKMGYTIRESAKSSTNKVNQSMDINKTFQCNERKASCLFNVPDHFAEVNIGKHASTRFFKTEHEIDVHDALFIPMNAMISKTNTSKESSNKHFEESLDEDDDVVFIAEVKSTVQDEESGKKSMNKLPNEGDDEIMFEKEISFAERMKANKSNANSSQSTITQILELIENSVNNTSRKINLSKISKNSQSQTNPEKFKTLNASVTTQSEKAFALHNEMERKGQSNRTHVSSYFSKANDTVKNLDVSLKTDELLSAELDLSDIKWEDDFGNDKEYPGCNKVDSRIDYQKMSNFRPSVTDSCRKSVLNEKEASFKTNSDTSEIFLGSTFQTEKSITDRSKISLFNEKEESFKTNSDLSEIFLESKRQMETSIIDRRETSPLNKREESFITNSDGAETITEINIRTEKTSPAKIMDFDVGDCEWDSDFELPANQAASLRQFGYSNTISTPNKLKGSGVLELASQKPFVKLSQSPSLSNFVASTKKKLSTKKSEMLKPSTSRDCYFAADSDFEDDFFQKPKDKFKTRNNRDLNINYVLTMNKNRMSSKKFNFLKCGKENVEPNSRLMNLKLYSANQKNRDAKKVPLYRGGTIDDRKKVPSRDQDSRKRKKFQYRNRKKSEFIDYEVEVSSDTSSGTSGEDDDLEGFVSHTQLEPETVDMRAHYLHSIKDVHKTDAFLFKKPTTFVPDDEIFSQPMSEVEQSAYLHDSFCVSGGEDDVFTEIDENSVLELTEGTLKNKKRKRLKNGKVSETKKRKVAERLSDSNSSEDETEKLREQINNESIVLKRNKY